ncbi:MAG: peptide chain release factor 3 [Thermomicrobiales bacterium]
MIEQVVSAPADVATEAARRRTFAIISHPDAGKTTLTEKLLLYAGAVEVAGAVRGRKNSRHARADWLSIEQERGITVTSTALQFDYAGCRFNLLDTPGHQDFSEDTYRTLMAADGAVMVIDAARGIQQQTMKLFEVCKRRRIPIVTFINKLDQPALDPLALLDEIERTLGIDTVPMTWPIGDGIEFQGVYDLPGKRLLRFDRTEGGRRRAPVIESDLLGTHIEEAIDARSLARLRDEVALIQEVNGNLDFSRFQHGEQTPVFFGSALTNFGVGLFLDALVELLPSPGPRASEERIVEPDEAAFSGFIFKIQANMDAQHRDRMAFLRVCSGRFEKDMEVHHSRLGRRIRLSRPHRLFAQERTTAEVAYAGDIVGLVNPGTFVIGDSLSAADSVRFDPIPRFPPEIFGLLENRDSSRYKQFHKGVIQLEEEGVMQVFFSVDRGRQPILAVVGDLQLDVAVARLNAEYGAESSIHRLQYTMARWIERTAESSAKLEWPSRDSLLVEDLAGNQVGLFASAWGLRLTETENPTYRFEEMPATHRSSV